jgi:hypothetical protein
MTPDWTFGCAAVLATYLLHSTLSLSAAWMVDRRRWIVSHALRETLWKAAAVVPLFSTAVTCVGGWSQPLVEIALDVRAKSSPRNSLGDAGETTQADAAEVRPQSTTRQANETYSNTHVETKTPRRNWQPRAGEDIAGAGISKPASSNARASSEEPSKRTDHESTDNVATSSVQSLADNAESPRQSRANSDRHSSATGIGGVSQITSRTVDVLLAGLLLLLPMGVALCVVRFASVARRFSRGELLTAGPARAMLDRIRLRAGIRRDIRLRRSPRAQQPLACGLIRWTIALPAATETHLNEKQLEALLAHELAHLVRGDVAWLWFGQLLCTCLCWQPLNFVARRRWRSAAEYRCDDWAVDSGAEPLSLASCLTEVAGWRITGGSPALGETATGTPSEFGRRIRRLASMPQADRWQGIRRRWCLRVCIALLTAALGCWAPRAVWSIASSPVAAARDVDHSALRETRAVTDGAPPVVTDRDDPLDPETLGAWRQLNEELRALHKTIQRLPAASENRGDARVNALIEQLRQRAARLEARRLRLAKHWGKDAPSVDAALGAASIAQP